MIASSKSSTVSSFLFFLSWFLVFEDKVSLCNPGPGWPKGMRYHRPAILFFLQCLLHLSFALETRFHHRTLVGQARLSILTPNTLWPAQAKWCFRCDRNTRINLLSIFDTFTEDSLLLLIFTNSACSFLQ